MLPFAALVVCASRLSLRASSRVAVTPLIMKSRKPLLLAAPALLRRLPFALGKFRSLGALALALILLIVGSVSITRTYLAHQEERRRLEAEAAERAQHPLYYADTITAYADAQELDPALVAAVILVLAFGASLLIPKPADLTIHKEVN